jgi:HlyD family secretion protein
LLRLDDVQARAELSIVRAQLLDLTAKKARLLAERDGLADIEFPRHLLAKGSETELILLGENRIFHGNRLKRQSQKQQLELSIEQLGEEIKGLEAQRQSKMAEIQIVEAEHQKLRGLAEKRLIEGSRVHSADRDVTRLPGERGGIEAGIARAKVRMSEIRLQIIAVDDAAQTEAQRELSTVETKLSELDDRRAVIEDKLSRNGIRAPVSGVVHDVRVHTIGGVITPAEKLLVIVPEDAVLKVEAKISPNDIDQVSLGQSAKLRFSAFNQRTTPELNGEVVYVSPATTRESATSEYYYTGRIEVFASELARLGSSNKLLPGMPVEVFISTDERTALSYLAKPFLDQFNRAFREQ